MCAADKRKKRFWGMKVSVELLSSLTAGCFCLVSTHRTAKGWRKPVWPWWEQRTEGFHWLSFIPASVFLLLLLLLLHVLLVVLLCFHPPSDHSYIPESPLKRIRSESRWWNSDRRGWRTWIHSHPLLAAVHIKSVHRRRDEEKGGERRSHSSALLNKS